MTRLLILPFLLFPSLAFALEPGTPERAIAEVEFLLNTMLLLFCGVLVMFMAAGFAMLEAGMVRSKSVAVILTKNIALYSIAGIMFYLVGYNLMYTGVEGGWHGIPALWNASDAAAYGDFSGHYAKSADWFFQMVFVATTASIVSGTLAERIKIWPFLIFTALLSGFIYPLVGSWKWGGGWLETQGFIDFAGSTMVHSVGGWCALVGAILLGARRGRFDENGKAHFFPGASMPQVTLGTFILWMGWFGFNGGSQLAFGSATDAIAVGTIFANTNIAAAGGVVTILIVSQLRSGKLDLPMMLNGALAGLVSITAEPTTSTIGQAALIGGAGALLMMIAAETLERIKIDDVVGAIPVHLVAGIWGTLAVCFTNPDATLNAQLAGIGAVGAFVLLASFIVWTLLRVTVGIRLHWTAEKEGADISEVGLRAYNLDFGTEAEGKPAKLEK